MKDYRLCGWRVRCELPLPELPALPDDSGAIPDIVIRLGHVPESLDDLVGSVPFAQVGRDGTCLLELRAIGRFLVSPRGGDYRIAASAD